MYSSGNRYGARPNTRWASAQMPRVRSSWKMCTSSCVTTIASGSSVNRSAVSFTGGLA